jgi:VanZ family protein
MISRSGEKNSDESFSFNGIVCFSDLRCRLPGNKKDAQRAVALFLEIFWIPGFNRLVNRLDHVPIPEMNASSPVLLWGPAILYAALIFWLSSLSRVPTGPENSDKVFHFFEYFLFAALLWRALRQHFQKRMFGRILTVLLMGAIYAASDEIHQIFVPGRTSSVFDWIADVAGILGMLTLMLIAVKWRGTAFKYDSL